MLERAYHAIYLAVGLAGLTGNAAPFSDDAADFGE